MPRGKFIVIEGGEGVGKTTQVDLLTKKLQSLGRQVEFVREPGGDPMAEKIREIVLDEHLDRLPETEVFLFNAARVQTLAKVRDLLEQGVNVLSDRSYLSTIAMQGYGHGLDLDSTRAVCELAVKSTSPDLLVVLTAPSEVVNPRRTQRGISDRFEKMDQVFHDRVNAGYMEEAKRLNLPIIDASQGIEEIAADIWQLVEPLVKEGI